MSIIDGLPSSAAEIKNAAAMANAVLGQAIPHLKLAPKLAQLLGDAGQGTPAGVLAGFSKDRCDALFLEGVRLFRTGSVMRARELFFLLHMMQPLEARILYALALTYQTQNEIEPAAKILVFYLALDATNPDGHLRLGECFLSAREYENAADCFRTALRLCRNGHGSQRSRAYAQRMSDYVDALTLARVSDRAAGEQDNDADHRARRDALTPERSM